MDAFADLLRQGAADAWLFVPTAIVLGALHGLEPGHSKTMMVSFVVAVRGSAPQAVLLGLSAALSHSLVVWILALAALTYGDALIADRAEPYFMALSGAIILGMAAWIFLAARRKAIGPKPDHGHDHTHGAGEADAHARAHEADIAKRFAGRQVTTPQIVLFGLTGGLLPCPAAIAIVLICLQIREYTLGIGMVAAFSVGLALTLVSVGATAAWGAAHVSRRFAWLDEVATRLPYMSAGFIALLGAFALWQGVRGLP